MRIGGGAANNGSYEKEEEVMKDGCDTKTEEERDRRHCSLRTGGHDGWVTMRWPMVWTLGKWGGGCEWELA
jgi:hypothetical protein